MCHVPRREQSEGHYLHRDDEYDPGTALSEFVCAAFGCVGITTTWLPRGALLPLPLGALLPLRIASTIYALNRPQRRMCDQQINNLIAAIAPRPQEMKAHAA
jgi:hypothetical protein